jgi:hypothetical protein
MTASTLLLQQLQERCLKDYARENYLEVPRSLVYNADSLHHSSGPASMVAYGRHHDCNLLNTDSGSPVTAAEKNLRAVHQMPETMTKGEMQVVTVRFCSDENAVSTIRWYETAESKKPLAEVRMSGRTFLHVQSHNSQFFYHEITSDSNAHTFIVTMRLTHMFQLTTNMRNARMQKIGCGDFAKWATQDKYVVTNVKSSTGGTLLPKEPTDVSHLKPVASVEKSKRHSDDSSFKLPNKRFKCAPPNVDWLPKRLITDGRPTWETLTSAPFFNVIATKASTPTITVQWNPARNEPKETTFGHFVHDNKVVQPGTVFDAATIYAKLGLLNTTQKHASWAHDGRRVNAVALRYFIKNDMDGLLRYIQSLLPGTHTKCLARYFWIGGCGGAAVTAGSKGCASFDSTKATKVAPVATLHSAQKLSGLNLSLHEAMLRDGTVQIFFAFSPGDVVYELVFPKDYEGVRPTVEQMMYLGLFAFDEVNCRKGSTDQTNEIIANFQLSSNDEAIIRSRLGWFFRFYVKPIPIPACLQNRQGPMPTAHVKQCDDRQIGITVPESKRVMECLRLTGDSALAEDCILQAFVESRGWETFLDDVEVTDDQGDLNVGISITAEEALNASYHVSCAGMARALRHNIEGTTAKALPNEYDDILGPLLRNIPMPMPNRTMDSTTSFFLATHGNPQIGEKLRIPPTNELRDALFDATLMRLTGNPQARAVWCDSYKCHAGIDEAVADTPKYFPLTPDKFEHYKEFLLHCDRIGNLEGSMKLSTSDQFSSSLPSTVKKLSSFLDVTTCIRDNIEKVTEQLHQLCQRTDSTTRERAVMKVKKFIQEHIGSGKENDGGTMFVAAQIVADLEELYGLIFGDVMVIHTGYGGKQGAKAIRSKRIGGKANKLTPTETCRLILDNIDLVPDDRLPLNGWVRTGAGDIVNKSNRRKVNLVDCEHICCKVYVFIVSTLANRMCNIRNPWRPSCHPTPVDDIHKFTSVLLQVCQEGLHSLQTNAKLPPLAEPFRTDKAANVSRAPVEQ